MMEIRRRLSRPVYEDEPVALQQALDSAIADARHTQLNNTDDYQAFMAPYGKKWRPLREQ